MIALLSKSLRKYHTQLNRIRKNNPSGAERIWKSNINPIENYILAYERTLITFLCGYYPHSIFKIIAFKCIPIRPIYIQRHVMNFFRAHLIFGIFDRFEICRAISYLKLNLSLCKLHLKARITTESLHCNDRIRFFKKE